MAFENGHTHSAKPRKRRTEQALEAPDEQKKRENREKSGKMAVTEKSKITQRITLKVLIILFTFSPPLTILG